jgi:tRNA nucleotidyltransferase/poly(A) polymerase
VRFAFRYGFAIDAKDTSLIQKNIALLQNISIERIKDEFEKIFLLQNTDALKYLQEI